MKIWYRRDNANRTQLIGEHYIDLDQVGVDNVELSAEEFLIEYKKNPEILRQAIISLPRLGSDSLGGFIVPVKKDWELPEFFLNEP